MSNFCKLKELVFEHAQSNITKHRDYIIGKYLRLIYICLYVNEANQQLLHDTEKFAFYYNASKLDSH